MKTRNIFSAVILHICMLATTLAYGEITPPWFGQWSLTSDFGPRLNGGWDFHEGIDYNAAYGNDDIGTLLPALESGQITAIATWGSFYNINFSNDQLDREWFYGHIFNSLKYINDWELLLNVDLVNVNNSSDVQKGNVIVRWLDKSANKASKVLSLYKEIGTVLFI